jgi:hypothetical protein
MSELIAALGWPHFSFAFGLLFLLLFKAQIAGLLSRVTSIDKSGIRTQPVPDTQAEGTRRVEAAQELLLEISDTVVTKEVESKIRQDLELRGLETTGETIKVLIKYLAASQCFLQFEHIHSAIFSSQIGLLRRLNQFPGNGQSVIDVEAYFSSVQSTHAPTFDDWLPERYLNFLFYKNLIIKKDGRILITHLGNEYLIWLAKSGKSEGIAL